MKVFITGDRAVSTEQGLIGAGQVILGLALECALHGDRLEIVSGDNKGIERGVHEMGRALGVLVEMVGYECPDASSTDWDARHKIVNEMCDKVVVIHTDIFSSRMAASAVRVVPEDKLLRIGS